MPNVTGKEFLITVLVAVTKDLTEAQDNNEDAVDDELPDGGPHVDLLVHVHGRHLPGVPHAPHQVGELVPASLLWLSTLLNQGEIVIAHLEIKQFVL